MVLGGGLFLMSEVSVSLSLVSVDPTAEEPGRESINAFSAVLSTEGRVVGLCWEEI